MTRDHRLEGTVRWTYPNRGETPREELRFNLWANFDEKPDPALSEWANAQDFFNAWEPSTTRIQSIVDVHGKALSWALRAAAPVSQTYNLQHIHLVVHLPRPLAPGASTTVIIAFRTRIPHHRTDQGYFNGDTTWRFGWFPQPCYRVHDRWSEALVLTAFTHDTILHVPRGKTGIIGADRIERHGRTVVASSSKPVRSLPLVVSSRLRAMQRRIAGTNVTLYYYGHGALVGHPSEAARHQLDNLTRILIYYREQFGPNRLASLQVVESPATTVSMAADGLVLLSDLFFVYNRTWLSWGIYNPEAEVVLAHEVAHQ